MQKLFFCVNEIMKFFQIILILISTLISNNLLAFNAKPSIAVFVLGESQNINSVNISVVSSLKKQGFIAKDGNFHLKKINYLNDYDVIIENSDFLSEVTDTDLFIILKINHQSIKNNSSKIFIYSDIFNTQTKNFITSWSTPRKIINFANECNLICKNISISQSIILLANQLGKSLGGLLDLSSNETQNYKNISKTYNFKSSNIIQNDIIYIIDLMVNEFPGYIKLSNQETYGDQSMWTYYSTSETEKLKRWLIIALGERNLILDRDYELTVSDNNFFIKQFPKFNSIGSKGNPEKFN